MSDLEKGVSSPEPVWSDFPIQVAAVDLLESRKGWDRFPNADGGLSMIYDPSRNIVWGESGSGEGFAVAVVAMPFPQIFVYGLNDLEPGEDTPEEQSITLYYETIEDLESDVEALESWRGPLSNPPVGAVHWAQAMRNKF